LILSYEEERVILETESATAQIVDAYIKVVGFYQSSKMKHYIIFARKNSRDFYMDLSSLSSSNEVEKQFATYGITRR
jgi:hypothetical protein